MTRRRGGLLHHRDFRLLWMGETASRFGSNITGVAMPLVAVMTLDVSTFWVGAVAAAAWLPWLLIGLPAGVWVDRMRRRPLMVASNIASLLLLLSVPVAAWTEMLTLAHLMVVALLTGVTNVLFGIAYRVYLPTVVERRDLVEANAKLQGSESAAQLAGLGSGGLLAGAFGAVSGLLVNAGTFLVSTLCLLRIRTTEPEPERSGEHARLRRDVAEGIRYTLRDPYLRVLTGYGAVTNLLLTGYQVILTVYLVRELSVGAAAVGWLLAAGSAGGLLGAFVANPLARRFGTARAMIWSKLVTAPFALLVPLAQPGWGVVLVPVGGAVLAMGVVSANIIQSSFRQQYCPPALLGRVIASHSVANFGAIPLGSLMGGALGTALGLRPAMWLLTAGLAVTSLLLLVGPMRRGRDLPSEPPTGLPIPAPVPAPTPEARTEPGVEAGARTGGTVDGDGRSGTTRPVATGARSSA